MWIVCVVLVFSKLILFVCYGNMGFETHTSNVLTVCFKR